MNLIQVNIDCPHDNLVTFKRYDDNNFLVGCEQCKLLFGLNEKLNLLIAVGTIRKAN